jgi:hypothetical protein
MVDVSHRRKTNAVAALANFSIGTMLIKIFNHMPVSHTLVQALLFLPVTKIGDHTWLMNTATSGFDASTSLSPGDVIKLIVATKPPCCFRAIWNSKTIYAQTMKEIY